MCKKYFIEANFKKRGGALFIVERVKTACALKV